MHLSRLLLAFLIGLFIKKVVDSEEEHMKKLYSNIVKYDFKTIQPFTK